MSAADSVDCSGRISGNASDRRLTLEFWVTSLKGSRFPTELAAIKWLTQIDSYYPPNLKCIRSKSRQHINQESLKAGINAGTVDTFDTHLSAGFAICRPAVNEAQRPRKPWKALVIKLV